MKRPDNIEKGFYYLKHFCILLIFAFGIIISFGHSSTIDAAIPQKSIFINQQNKTITVTLKEIKAREALEEIAQKTGIEFIGLDKITNTIEDLNLIDQPIEEAIKEIGKDSILIFRKEGPEDGEKELKKVIVLVQKEIPPPEPPKPQIITPPPPPPAPPTPPPPPKKVTPPPAPTPPPPPKEMPPRPVPQPRPLPPAPEEKPCFIPPVLKAAPAVKVEIPTAAKECLKLGQKYFDEKRWDLAAKNLRCYLEKNPDDQPVKDKVAKANEYATEAIRLYKSAKIEVDNCNLENAYDLYQKSYKLYPLLYDTWERLRELKKQCPTCR